MNSNNKKQGNILKIYLLTVNWYLHFQEINTSIEESINQIYIYI